MQKGVLSGIRNDHRFPGPDDLAGYQFVHLKTNLSYPFLGGAVIISCAWKKEFLLLLIQQYDHTALCTQKSFDLIADIIQQFLQIRIFRQCHADAKYGLVVEGNSLFAGNIP